MLHLIPQEREREGESMAMTMAALRRLSSSSSRSIRRPLFNRNSPSLTHEVGCEKDKARGEIDSTRVSHGFPFSSNWATLSRTFSSMPVGTEVTDSKLGSGNSSVAAESTNPRVIDNCEGAAGLTAPSVVGELLTGGAPAKPWAVINPTSALFGSTNTYIGTKHLIGRQFAIPQIQKHHMSTITRKGGASGLNHESSKSKRSGLFQRMTAISIVPLFVISKLSSTLLLFPSLFWHMKIGIEEIMGDYVHHEITRTWILVFLRLFFLIVLKDVLLSLVM